ncbi:MAG: ABC transporter ATP-binding protein [Bacilli bacterium]
MKKTLHILKKYTFAICLVVVLLFLQALCDLSLPDYTARIVNIGIQQKGIEKSVPIVIRATSLDKVLMFAKETEKKIITANYTLINKNNLSKENYQKYLKKYPLLSKEPLYILNDLNKKETTKLAQSIKIPYLIAANLSAPHNKQIKPTLPNSTIDFKTLNTKDIRTIFSKQLTKYDDNILLGMINNNNQKEYKEIGINLDQLQMNYIIIIGLKMLSLALLSMIIAIIVTYYSSKIATSFSRDLRGEVVQKIMLFSSSEFKKYGTASLITRSTNDIVQIQMLLVMLLRVILYAPIIGLGALSKVSNSSMSWIIGVAILTILSLVIILFVIAMPKFKIMQTLIDKLNLVSREILTGLPVIRAFNTEKHEEKRFDKANVDLTKTNLFINRIMTIMMPSMMFIMNGICVLIVWVGANRVDLGTMQVGTLMAFITYTMQIIMAFLMISMVSIMLPRAFVSIRRTNEILNQDLTIKDTNKPIKCDKNKKGTIEFKHVYFRYADAIEDVLEDISFKIEKATTTAFIGSTGSGKSTLINLIPRFFDITSGKILIDGIDIKDFPLNVLRAKIGYVPQKGILFTGTIESNIAFGNKKLTKEQLLKAARISQSEEFIMNTEDKLLTPISQGGINISGGQKQRLSIARAIAINPEFYIFDDSFSALDYKTDSNLRASLALETKGSTKLIVAQRISSIIKADQIIVIDKGKIVGKGTHNYLMNNCEIYKQISLSQLSKEELDKNEY